LNSSSFKRSSNDIWKRNLFEQNFVQANPNNFQSTYLMFQWSWILLNFKSPRNNNNNSVLIVN